MKKYLVLGALFSFVWIQMLLFGCTRGMVRPQKESTPNLRASRFEEVNRHLVKNRSEDGITTYIVLDRKGKMAGIRMVKNPLEKRPKPMTFSDTNSMLRPLKKQKKVGKIITKFWAAGTATVSDFDNYIQKLKEKRDIKVDLVIIDYITLVAPIKGLGGDNLYTKGKHLAEGLRALGAKYKCPVITGVQVAKDAWFGAAGN